MEQDYKDGFDGFEDFLSKEAEKLSMYPSDRVWLGVRKVIQPKKKWPGLSLTAIFLTLSLALPTFLNYQPVGLSSQGYKSQNSGNVVFKKAIHDDISNDPKGSITFNVGKTFLTQSDLFAVSTRKNHKRGLFSHKKSIKDGDRSSLLNELNPTISSKVDISGKGFEKVIDNVETMHGQVALKTLKVDTQSFIKQPLKYSALKLLPIVGKTNEVEEHYFRIPQNYSSLPINIRVEAYATPSISFREVQDDNSREKLEKQNSGSNNGNYSKLRHIPALGMEIGVGLNYFMAHGLSVTTGVQFNERHYYIDAYESNGFATIAVVQGDHLDTITILSKYSNNGLNKQATKLDNKINQISIPFGMQWDVIRSKKFEIGISASLQPTLTLNQDVYLVSTDYKNYANGSAFLRKWNINSSFNLKIGYKIGKVSCYLAPQYRIQHLPTYNDLYPIKEYRTDYGLRIGIQKNI